MEQSDIINKENRVMDLVMTSIYMHRNSVKAGQSYDIIRVSHKNIVLVPFCLVN